jgi:serine/threonine protein kinase/lipoprotein NlpI
MVAALSDSDADALAARLADEMAERWRQGERPLAEEFLERHPELSELPEAATELIYEELCLRQEHGELVAAEDVLRRFPHWEPQLQVLLDCHQLMQADMAVPTFPEVGDTLGDFLLMAELGRGAHGRVFLATQPALANRPVVLKVVPHSLLCPPTDGIEGWARGLGGEHLSLARLQHTHVVPLYFVQDFPDRLLRALCLPYFGGATLASLLEAMHGIPLEQRSGRLLLDGIRQSQAASPIALPVRGSACHFLAGASYVEAACWVGACLADALQYAHERGVLHLDLKPANVLLAADGQPMLLDFHLARAPLAPGARPPAWLGGTPAYMAPEQRAAWQAVREGRSISSALDGRADLFALGMLLHELLGGGLPEPDPASAAELPRLNPSVTPGLAAIIGKCLAEDPHARYPDAAALAEDLRRHLKAQPLRGVPNRSWRERWQKWRRRRPHMPTYLALLLLVAVGLGLVGWRVQNKLDEAREALHEGRTWIEREQYEPATSALERGLALTDGMPFSDALRDKLREHLQEVAGLQAVRELHQFVERARLATGAVAPPPDEERTIERHCRELWQYREQITALFAQGSSTRSTESHNDLLDLAILWTRLRVRLASPDDRAVTRHEALEVLAEAEKLCGPSCVLSQERRQHATALGLTALAEEAARQAAPLPPRTAWEHNALGRALLESGNPSGAAAHFGRALEIQPDDFWAHYHDGQCAYLLKRHDRALVAFTACIALAPRSAWCRYNRGLVNVDLSRLEGALLDFNQALVLDPHLADAVLQRGLLHYRGERYDAAVKDLRQALKDGANAATAHYGLALVYRARGDQAAAVEELREALRCDPSNMRARELLKQLQRKG